MDTVDLFTYQVGFGDAVNTPCKAPTAREVFGSHTNPIRRRAAKYIASYHVVSRGAKIMEYPAPRT
eukprot:6187794-Pleurochrysis_carterae.AAC.2